MKAAKTIFVFLMATILLMVSLCSCNKTEADPDMEAFIAYVRQVAAETGVTAEELLESGYITFEQWQAGEISDLELMKDSDTSTQLEEFLSQIVLAYQDYLDASSSQDIIFSAEAFNELYSQCIALAVDVIQKDVIASQIAERTGQSSQILQSIYLGKAALAGSDQVAEYTDVFFYYHPENPDSKFLCSRLNENNEVEIFILHNNGSSYAPDLTAIKALNPSYCAACDITESSLYVTASVNGEWLMFEFPLDDASSQGSEIPFEEITTEYLLWYLSESTLAGFHQKETGSTIQK